MRKWLITVTLAAASVAPTMAEAGKLQCWVDDQGVRACGDRVPPQYADKERKLLNSQGIVIGTKARQKTEAEVAEDKRRIEAQATEKKRFEEQAAYDRFMLQTFEGVAQMQGVRDTRLTTLDGRLRLAQKSITDTEAALKELRERLAANEKSGKPDVRLPKQIAEFETSLVDTLKSVAQLKKEREDILAKSDSDIERFKKLRAGLIQIGSLPSGAPPPAMAPAAAPASAPAAAPPAAAAPAAPATQAAPPPMPPIQ